MTVVDVQPASFVSSAASDSRGALLSRVLDVLDREGVAYCIAQGYRTLPEQVNGDVDMIVAHEALPKRIFELLRSAQAQLGARVVQWFVDRAHFIVLQATAADGMPAMLQLHLSVDYDISNRLIYEGNEILRTRRRHERNFWIPAAHVEFICTLCNRIAKGSIEERHANQLSELWGGEREKCAHEMFRFFDGEHARMIADAAEANLWELVRRNLPQLRKELMHNAVMRQPMSYLTRLAAQQARRMARWTRPRSGLHVVFLGPDGVGKSTVIEAVQQRVAEAFLDVKYHTFARSLLANKPKKSPHELPPRSLPASYLKAAWWLCCYTLGYLKSTHPTRARGGLAINHRYLVDAIVDPKRYRYSASTDLLWSIWQIVPKPDLIVFLDAPAEVIWQRKKETTLEETARQCAAYRAMAAKLPNARIVDTSQSPEMTIEQVTELILGIMAARMMRRF